MRSVADAPPRSGADGSSFWMPCHLPPPAPPPPVEKGRGGFLDTVGVYLLNAGVKGEPLDLNPLDEPVDLRPVDDPTVDLSPVELLGSVAFFV